MKTTAETANAFTQLKLHENLLNNLTTLGYESMTPIQGQSLPTMLEGRDVIAKAQTGSGKTAAFGLCLLNKLRPEDFFVQALILCPTRELADQVAQALRQLARLMPNIKILNLSGGTPMRPQLETLKHGAHVVVGTPGRVLKHLDKQTLTLQHLQTLVLDEADRMLDMGFIKEIKGIIRQCPQKRQTLLFSATYADEIKKLAHKFMQQPQEILIDTPHTQHAIEQYFYKVNNAADKFELLKHILLFYQPRSTLVFCNTKQQTAELAESLSKKGFSAIALNGDMEQPERDLAFARFSNLSCSILVATDVAARGLDIKELPAVVNYDLAFEKDTHVHRIGRTGRAGHSGLAFSMVASSDGARLAMIEEKMAAPITYCQASELTKHKNKVFVPDMVTICISAGKKNKIRAGDILGALTKEGGLPGEAIGKMHIGNFHAFVAIQREHVNDACRHFQNGKLKGGRVNVKKLE